MIEQNHSLIVGRAKQIGPVTPPAEVMEPTDLLGSILRGKKVIFAIVVILMTLTSILVFQITPRYTSNALIMISRPHSNIVGFDSIVAGLTLDTDTIASEIEILKSRGLAAKVIESLDLSSDPEFNAQLKPKGAVASFLQEQGIIPESWKNFLRPQTDRADETADTAAIRTRVIDKFIEGLEVYRKGSSRMIEVNYTSKNPETAARAANMLVDIYIGEQLVTKVESTRDASKLLTERVEPLRKKVLRSEKAIEQYRQKSGLVENKGTTLNSQQMSELNNQLILAQADYLQARSRLEHINRLANQQDGIESAPEVLDSALIQKLREQEAGLQGKLSELSAEFGNSHPTMIQLRAELGDLQRKIRVEVNKVISSIRYEAEVAEVRKSSLENSLGKLKEEEAKLNSARVELQALQREAEADRNVLEALLARLKETSSQENADIYQPDARVISVAEVPLEAAYPKTVPILGLMFFASLFSATLFLFFRNSRDRGFLTGEQIELQTGMPFLGNLKKIRAGLLGGKPAAGVLTGPDSEFAEAVRNLYTNMVLTASSGHPQKILVTSAEAGEGATTTAACLAKTRAVAGNKTIVVDLNLRSPGMHTVFGIPRSPGMTEYLSGNVSFDEIVHQDPLAEIDIIPAGANWKNPTDILMGKNLGELMRELGNEYDIVVFDSAPILAVPDTRLLLDMVDATVMVVRWAHTKRSIVRKALTQIIISRERFLGIVLNRVDMKKHF